MLHRMRLYWNVGMVGYSLTNPAVDILKISNVPDYLQPLVFKHGLNFVYPSLDILLARSHLYKTQANHTGNAFKSTGNITLLEDWNQADSGLKKAV